jgi:glycosyltransferase involved in cell wall biosynthesis
MNGLTAKPKVTLDIRPLFEDQWTGIPVFTRRLAEALLRCGAVDLEFAAHHTRVPAAAVQAAIRVGAGTLLREQFETDAIHGYDLIDHRNHLLFPSVKGDLSVGAHEASTVHDMSTLFMPENHEPANVAHHLDHFEAELLSNEVTFCISVATQNALLTAYPGLSEKVRLLYQYVDWPEQFAVLERNEPPLQLGRYAVVIGTIEPRKNLKLLIDALASTDLARSGTKFVVIGRKGWLVDKLLAELPPEARSRLLFSGFVSEFVKYRLIQGAAFMVFPSIYEGFGIPALEAMSLGKPVLSARTSSLPEVVGDGGLYFDPLSISEFTAALAEIDDDRKIADLAPRARSRNAAFGWQRMAAPVVEWARG